MHIASACRFFSSNRNYDGTKRMEENKFSVDERGVEHLKDEKCTEALFMTSFGGDHFGDFGIECSC